jgi:hypothetical protein
LLNCGAHIAAAGGTDAMANYASLRGPVGLNRTFVRVTADATTASERRDSWIAGLTAGVSMASNGPLVALTVNGEHPGGEIALSGSDREVSFSGMLRSALPVDHLELVLNGAVIETFDTGPDKRTTDVSGSVTLEESGWLLLRAWSDDANPLLLDIYPYATTSPIYVSVDGKSPTSADDAEYFLSWLDNIRSAVTSRTDFNNDAERKTILSHLDAAEVFYQNCR